MEKERKNKKIVLVVLLVLLIGLSVGFAAFGKDLTIKSGASVTPDPNSFEVVFSTSKTSSVEGSPVLEGMATGGTLAKDTTKITDLTANFTAPGQTATWKFYSYNSGIYEAFLNDVTIGSIICEPAQGVDPAKVTEAAKAISISVSVGGKTFNATSTGIEEHNLPKNEGEEIVVSLTYAEGQPLVDGNFNVSVGDIVLGYDSID